MLHMWRSSHFLLDPSQKNSKWKNRHKLSQKYTVAQNFLAINADKI